VLLTPSLTSSLTHSTATSATITSATAIITIIAITTLSMILDPFDQSHTNDATKLVDTMARIATAVGEEFARSEAQARAFILILTLPPYTVDVVLRRFASRKGCIETTRCSNARLQTVRAEGLEHFSFLAKVWYPIGQPINLPRRV